MGAAAAVSFQRAGYRTLLWLRDRQKIGAAEQTLFDLAAWMQTHVGPPLSTSGRTDVVSELSALDAKADVVLDCIAEVMEDKVSLFNNLPKARTRQALFLTTTSGLSITQLGRLSETGPMLAGTHFWNPPHLMPLVEVIRGQETRDDVIDRAVALIESLGKIAVRVERDVPGFIGNRLLHAMWREAIHLIQSGIASPTDVDRVARLTFGLRLPAVGPLENMDLVGLDLVRTIHDYLLADLAGDLQPQPLLNAKVQGGTIGMKSGLGFYDWQARDPGALVDRRDRQIVRQLDFLREIDAL